MSENNLIYGGEKKSVFRKKWDLLFKKIALKRVPKIYHETNKVLVVENQEQLRSLIDIKNKNTNKEWKIIVITVPLNNFINLVDFFNNLNNVLSEETKIIINYYSIVWKPVFFVFSILGLINNYKEALFFSKKTLDIFLRTSNYEISKSLNDAFIPLEIPVITKILSIITNSISFLRFLSFTKVYYLRKKFLKEQLDKKMSLIIPCKNEEGNIKNIIEESKKNLKFSYEIVFIDDKSSDNTLSLMKKTRDENVDIEIKIINGFGKGKSKAIDEGVRSATGYYSVIFDADLTVSMKDMNLFYWAISNGNGDLINGSRLIYKPYSGAMKKLNYLGNIFFSKLVTYITDENISDTLCGSKCFKTHDFKIFKEFEDKNNIHDLWGDFNILFASTFYGLKCIDLPVRYYERLEGETKMTKRMYFFKNMLLTCFKAFNRFKINFDK